MKRAHRRQQGLGAIELIEQAIHELRAAPAGTLASYYVGALPFVLGLLFYWADMSRSAFAEQHLTGAALGVAALFLWMKFWQAIFARSLRASIAGEPAPPLGLRRGCRILIAQTAVQPSGLFLLPLSAILILPLAWTCAFYQSLTVLAAADTGEVRRLARNAARQAALWPRQNYTLLAVLLAFGFYVFLDWTVLCFTLPFLAKTLLGVETVFTRSPIGLANTTFFAAMLGLTYLCVDPIMKAVYTLRCFYGESLESGEDLRAELRRIVTEQSLPPGGPGIVHGGASAGPGDRLPPSTAGRMPAAKVLVAVAIMMCAAAPARAAEPAKAAVVKPAGEIGSPGISAPELDRTIRDVLREAKYSWRMPREKVSAADDSQAGIIGRFLQRVGAFLRREIRAFLDWLEEWLRQFSRHPRAAHVAGYGWIMLLEVLLYALLAAVVVAVVWLLFRLWQDRRHKPGPLAAQPIQPTPDLRDENLGAEQLPEDGWTKLARELLGRGELRLAVRAFYFASLAHLAQCNLISLAKFKSNRDYERELERRGHSFPELLVLFGENVLVVDRTWYGLHPVSTEQVHHFAANVERMKGSA